jgi:hypothetical protein
LPQDQTVHFVHFSVREYVSRATAISIPALGTICLSRTAAENGLLSQICLRYMSYNDLIEENPPTKEVIQRKMDEYRFSQPLQEACLRQSGPDIPLQQTRFVLHGLGGSGKTQLCLKFAKEHREKYVTKAFECWRIFEYSLMVL